MERYVATTYRLPEFHKCAWGWYVTTTYHLYTNNGNKVKYVYEAFSFEFLICWRRAWDVLRFREHLSTSLADVLRQKLHLSFLKKNQILNVLRNLTISVVFFGKFGTIWWKEFTFGNVNNCRCWRERNWYTSGKKKRSFERKILLSIS